MALFSVKGGDLNALSSSLSQDASSPFSWSAFGWPDSDWLSVLVLCRNPYINYEIGMAFPCGSCEPCLSQRRKIWAHRIMLESLVTRESCFVTLTYSDENLPLITGLSTGSSLASLEPLALSGWLKRLRQAVHRMQVKVKRPGSIVSTWKLRFFAVGEYGEQTERPHYHAILFGLDTCARKRTRRVFGSSQPDWANCCARCRLLGETWGKGHVDLGTVEQASANYLTAYMLKGMQNVDDPRLLGRYPEFKRNSIGLGRDAMDEVARVLKANGLDESITDVPLGLRHGSHILPLGRYLRRRLRYLIGREVNAPRDTLEEARLELQVLQEIAWSSSQKVKDVLLAEHAGAADLLIAREQLKFGKRRKGL